MSQIKIKSETEPRLSDDPQINALLTDVVKRLKEYTENQVRHLNQLAKIGVALTSTRNLSQLLEMIVDEARAFTRADGGTLYLVDSEQKSLLFTIVQTESLGIRMGGVTGAPISWNPVPLYLNGNPNHTNVCAYVVHTGQMVSIDNVYEAPGFNFEGTRKFDASTGYHSRSMLVIPMTDHEGTIIGVLQLLNAQDPKTGEVIPFPEEVKELSQSLASQAAVAITNARLIQELQNLFDSFIRVIAEAIDEKSPYTGGHIERVANLTMAIAEKINEAQDGPYKDVHFTPDQLSELRLAAWLHDTGKITTPEYVVDKRTKLETIMDRLELVRLRFELAKFSLKLNNFPSHPREVEEQCRQLDEDFQFISSTNLSSEFLPDDKIERLQAIAQREVIYNSSRECLLTPDELYNLSVRKGNLTPEQRKIIENHVVMTIKMLEKLPFPKKWKNVPAIAGAHHEKLNGKGYPKGLKGDEIPLQTRIMALADIFEALTASDRPYKPAKKLSEVIKILNFMVKDNELDGDLVKFFLDQKMHLEYAHQHLRPDQIDVDGRE
ncbi:MAG: HD domain-containing phosphohydrolase [bacterium]